MKLDLLNQTFRIGYNNDLPYISVHANRMIGIESFLLKTMAQYFNFSFEMVDCNGTYGSKDANSTSWSGLVGLLSNNEIDLGLGGIMMTYNRLEVIKYLYPHFFDRLTFATSIPRKHAKLSILWKPFDWEVWISIFGTFLLFFVLDRIATRLRHSSTFDMNNSNKNKNLFWINLGLLFKQTSIQLRKADSFVKICSIVWAVSATILADFYCGFLCSSLAIPTLHAIKMVSTLSEACRSGQIIALVQPNSSLDEILSSNDLFKPIFQKKEPINNNAHGVQLMMKSSQNYAIISYRNSLIYFWQITGGTGFYLPPESSHSTISNSYITIPMRSSFGYERYFNSLILRIRDAGLHSYWFKRQMYHYEQNKLDISIDENVDFLLNDDNDDNDNNQPENFEKFSLNHLQIVFYLYFICVIVSILMILIEYCTYNHF